MKWLNKLAEKGLIRKQVLENIISDVELIKKANVPVEPSKMNMLLNLAVSGASAGAAGVLLSKGLSVISSIGERQGLKSALEQSKFQLLKNTPREDHAKASARFDEIAQIAPSVATNNVLVTKLIRENLNSGISAEQAHQLALIQYNYGIKKIGSIRPEVLGKIAADTFLLKEGALAGPAKPFFSRSGNFLKNLALLSGTAMLVNTAGGLVNWGASKLRERKLSSELGTAFNEALKGSSDTSVLLRAKPDAAKNAFQTLVHFAPHVALNPTAARGFMAKLVEYEGRVDSSDLKTLTDIQKNMSSENSAHPFLSGFATTSDTLGTKHLLHSGAKGAQAEFLHEMTGADVETDRTALSGRKYL